MVVYPHFTLTANGEDVTEHIKNNLMTLTFSDKDGKRSDQLTLKVAGMFSRPVLGDTLDLSLGVVGACHKYGIFKVNATAVDYKTSTTTVKATSVNFSEAMKERKDRLWEAQTLADIASTIAAENNLDIETDGAGEILLTSVAQQNKSDLEYLTELADEYGFLFTVKNETVLLYPKDTTERKAFEVEVDLTECLSLSIDRTSREEYASVKVIWQDLDTSENLEAIAGSGDPTLVIRDKHPKTHAEGLQMAKSILDEYKSGTVLGSLSIIGGKEIRAGQKLVLTGAGSDSGTYHIKGVTHTMSTTEYVVNVEFTETTGVQ